MKADIDILLSKYFDGETSLKEEQVLKEYFNSPEVSSEHEAYRFLFAAFEKEQQQKSPVKPSPVLRKSNSRFITYISLSAAAVALLFFAIHFPQQQSDETYAFIKGEKITEEQFIEEYTLAKLEKTYNIINNKLAPLESIQTVKQGVRCGINSIQEVKNTIEFVSEKSKKIDYEKNSHVGYMPDDDGNNN